VNTNTTKPIQCAICATELNETDLADPILAWPVKMEGFCCQECFEKRVSVANLCRHIHDRHYLGDRGFEVMCCIFLGCTKTRKLLAKAEREHAARKRAEDKYWAGEFSDSELDALADAGLTMTGCGATSLRRSCWP